MKKWIVLTLATLTGMLVLAMPLLALPVLFTEIADDLGLSLLQIGFVWGTASLAGMLTSLPAGTLGDRFGPRRTLSLACLLIGLFGALRALSFDYVSFMGTVLLHGLVTPAIAPNVHKTAGSWFPKRRGLAAGVVSAGFALGLALGSSLSASVLSPLLGGWDMVLLFYGVLAVIMSGMWFFLYPQSAHATHKEPKKRAFIQSLRHVMRSRELWLIGLGSLCFWACVRGFVGYLPLYLKTIGWNPVLADQTLAIFYAVSLIGVLPLSIASDRFGIRRGLMILAVSVLALGVFIFSFAEGLILWLAVIMAGIFFDAYMAIHQATAQEVDGIGFTFAGTALGFISTLREVGGFLSPPIGNALAEFGLGVPFIFWGMMGLLGAAILWLLPTLETGD